MFSWTDSCSLEVNIHIVHFDIQTLLAGLCDDALTYQQYCKGVPVHAGQPYLSFGFFDCPESIDTTMIHKSPGPQGTVRVTFSLPATFWADTIHLVGDFNTWDLTATPLHLDDNHWSVTLDLEAGKAFAYRYLINSTEWVNDWQADRFIPNESGGDNSVVVTYIHEEIPSQTDHHRHAAVQRPQLRVIQGGRQEKQAV